MALPIDHYIGRLQVAMQDTFVVSGSQTRAEPTSDVYRPIAGQTADTSQERAKVLTIYVLHRKKGGPVRFADIVHAANIGMRHLTCDAHLGMKPFQELRIFNGRLGKKLQRNRLT